MNKTLFYSLPSPVVYTNITSGIYVSGVYLPKEELLNKRWCIDCTLSFAAGASTSNTSRELRLYGGATSSLKNTTIPAATGSWRQKVYFVVRSLNDGTGNIVCSIPGVKTELGSFLSMAGALYKTAPLALNPRIGVGVQHAFADEVTTVERLTISYYGE